MIRLSKDKKLPRIRSLINISNYLKTWKLTFTIRRLGINQTTTTTTTTTTTPTIDDRPWKSLIKSLTHSQSKNYKLLPI